ncbi:unnamed protein product, partial [marine sediment metagenome]
LAVVLLENGDFLKMINPVLKESEGEKVDEEGCLSVPSSKPFPVRVFGKAITSRILSRPSRTIQILSIPGAIPPWGGAPYCRAFRRYPNL